MDLYQIWFRVSSRGRNQLCVILLQSAHGFRFCEGSKFAISHWLGWSPLTQCWRYRAACDTFIHQVQWNYSRISTTDLIGIIVLIFYWANRSRVSCAHNTLRAFIGLNITFNLFNPTRSSDVLLNISLNHSRSLNVIRNDILEKHVGLSPY